MNTSPIERIVLRKLNGGPRWMRSFQAAKPVVLRLIDKGLIRRVAPPGLRARNQIELTDVGQRIIGDAKNKPD